MSTSTTTTRRHVALRIPPDALAEIDQLAARHGLNRTDYMIRASTGQLSDPTYLDARFREIADRLSRVEHMADLGTFEYTHPRSRRHAGDTMRDTTQASPEVGAKHR